MNAFIFNYLSIKLILEYLKELPYEIEKTEPIFRSKTGKILHRSNFNAELTIKIAFNKIIGV